MSPGDLSALTGLAGTALGGAIGFLSATRLAWRNNKRVAGAKLRAAFAPELSLVRVTPQGKWQSIKIIVDTDGHDDLDRVLQRAFPKHATAIEEHRPFVPKRDRLAYQQAWEGYYLRENPAEFLDYMLDPNGHVLFCEKVEAIFRYAEV